MVGWQSAAWFQIPSKTRKPAFIEPYLWEGSLLASTVAPIIQDGQVMGVAGIDMQLGSLTSEINKIKVLQTGYSFVVSHTAASSSPIQRRSWSATTRSTSSPSATTPRRLRRSPPR